jgi:hypothetical protein
MKALPLGAIVISIIVIFAFNFSLVSALESGEASVSVLWLSQAVTNGDVVSVRVTFTNNSPDLLRIYRMGFHFDWMASNEYYTSDFSSSPVSIPSSALQVFDDLPIEIPFNISAGAHSYFIAVEGAQGLAQESFSWESSAFTIQINPIAAKVYVDLKSEVEGKLSNATAADYVSSEAKSLLQQAQTQYNTAKDLAEQEQWGDALISLESASEYLDQAEVAEQINAEQTAQQQQLLLIAAIVLVIVILVVSVIVVMARRKRKKLDEGVDQPFDQSFDEPLETQDNTPEE